MPEDGYAIYREFTVEPDDILITKQRASIFQGTPLFSHLSLLGVQSLIVCGESTSGCVRASVVDGYSNGFHVSVVEECTYDRAELTHKVNLFDMHHKYADVMHIDEVLAHLESPEFTACGRVGDRQARPSLARLRLPCCCLCRRPSGRKIPLSASPASRSGS